MSTVSFKEGGATLRVGKILCIGRNYPEHAREMKADLPNEPVVFLKPPSALVQSGGTVVIPKISNDPQHEVEMVVVIGKDGRNIATSAALEHVAGYAVGLDMTMRDIQADAKKKGLPWTVAKGFDTSAPISQVVNPRIIGNAHALSLSLKVNGFLRQQGNTADMLFHVEALISYLSTIFTLEKGDLIFTGTPEGVGSVQSGDRLDAQLGTCAQLTVTVA